MRMAAVTAATIVPTRPARVGSDNDISAPFPEVL
jgi:hypothetical protein